MTEFSSNDTGLAIGGRSHVQARLLCNDGEVTARNSRTAHETRGGVCVLTQSRSGFLPAAPAAEPKSRSLPSALSVYAVSARITCIDRTVIRAYFHPHDASAPARRKKIIAGSRGRMVKAEGQATLLPEALERRLSPLPAGYYRMRRGNSVFLVETGTHRIVDAVRGV